jgi:hypothetical protein
MMKDKAAFPDSARLVAELHIDVPERSAPGIFRRW